MIGRTWLVIVYCSGLMFGCQPRPEPMALHWQTWGDQQLEVWLHNSQQLAEQSVSYCAGQLELPALQDSWRQTFLHWSGLNAFPYKGVADLTLEFELYFWPDRRNRVEGQLRQRVAAAQEVEIAGLETRIAAEKGLAALEWLIFNAELEPTTRCYLLQATATDYANKVGSIHHYHQANPIVPQEWLAADAKSQSNSIALNLLFAQVTALESRLNNSIDDADTWLENQAWGWRAHATLPSLAASLNQLMVHLEWLAARPELTADSQAELQALLSDGNVLAQRAVQGDADLARAVLEWLDRAEDLLQNRASRDFNLLLGFNNFDGD